jgi:hypothetical protein
VARQKHSAASADGTRLMSSARQVTYQAREQGPKPQADQVEDHQMAWKGREKAMQSAAA